MSDDRRFARSLPPPLACTLGLAFAWIVACGDDGSGIESAGETTATGGTTAAGASAGSDSTTTASSNSDSDATTAGGESATLDTTTAATTEDSTTTGDPSTTAATETVTSDSGAVSVTEGTGESESESESESDSDSDGQCSCGQPGWSYLWVANTDENTVAKINTETLEEEGRYRTHPLDNGSPSRTSVSVDGAAVVVANRFGGVAKIWARPELCDPNKNKIPGLQTSTGKDDVLPWGQDDCVAWYADDPETTAQRPVAWTPGVYDAKTCTHVEQKVWTATSKNGAYAGQCGANGVTVRLLNGESGLEEASVVLPDAEFPCLIDGWNPGPYGAVVERDGSLWLSGQDNGKLARVDRQTLEYTIVQIPSNYSYGIGIDTLGRILLSGGAVKGVRYDPLTETWDPLPIARQGGLAVDHEGRIWMSYSHNAVAWVDPDTLAIGEIVTLPGSYASSLRGVSVDIHGAIWAVPYFSERAFRIDPVSLEISSYSGLHHSYTYSDMTGGSIGSYICPQ